MSTDHTRPTPQQAHEQLAASRALSLHSTRDRKIHAIGTAVFGASMGVFMAMRNMVTGVSAIALTCVYAAVLVAEVLWVERAARTVPRRAGRWSRLGIGASLVLALVVVLPWLNLQAQTEPNTWPMVLVAAVVVAVPSLVAATVIARGRK